MKPLPQQLSKTSNAGHKVVCIKLHFIVMQSEMYQSIPIKNILIKYKDCLVFLKPTHIYVNFSMYEWFNPKSI